MKKLRWKKYIGTYNTLFSKIKNYQGGRAAFKNSDGEYSARTVSLKNAKVSCSFVKTGCWLPVDGADNTRSQNLKKKTQIGR